VPYDARRESPMKTRVLRLTLAIVTAASVGGGVAACTSDDAPSCDDGVHNGSETGVDCGDVCGLCADAACTEDAACASGRCVALVCAAPRCDDGLQNGSEEGVDCGGTCQACTSFGADVAGGDAMGVDPASDGACPSHDEAAALSAVAQCQLNCEWAIGRYQRCLRDCDDLHALGLPDACRTCYSDWAICQFVSCVGACSANPEFDGCKRCIAEECDPAFNACR